MSYRLIYRITRVIRLVGYEQFQQNRDEKMGLTRQIFKTRMPKTIYYIINRS